MDAIPKNGERWAKLQGLSPYPVMDIDSICSLPVINIAAENSILLMWVTYPMLIEGLSVIDAWGFEFKTVAFTWVKQNPSGVGWHFGLGYHTRQNPELVLLGTRGKGLKRIDNTIPNLVIYPRGQHSAKPPVVRDKIVKLYGNVKRCELFARKTHPDFAAWGNEVPVEDSFGELNEFIAPPYQAITDEDEHKGLPVIDTDHQYSDGEQMRLGT